MEGVDRCNFVVGQKVVCVMLGQYKKWNNADYEGHRGPSDGEIVTIREIYVDPSRPIIGLRFFEYVNPICAGVGIEYGFNAREFRPLVERKTDISIFTKMLTGDKVPA